VDDWVIQQFEASRPRLRAIAHRMLGSPADAEDAVQEAWLRLSRAEPATVDNLAGWLTTVVSRVCLDNLRARRLRHEDVARPGLAAAEAEPADDAEPEGDVILAESIGPALVAVLDALEPPERLAFVLHDLFGVPFDEIAVIVERSPAATRQLASRARRRLRGQPGAAPGPGRGLDQRQRQLVEAFLAASRQGNFEALLALLDPEVILRSDPVAVRSARARQTKGAPELSAEIKGADAVARVFVGRAAGARAALVDGRPGAVAAGPGGRPIAAFIMRWRGGKLLELELVADPGRLRTLELVA
jgi:RNA polymerase sigma factor (sigma-70 family)